jgi:integrase
MRVTDTKFYPLPDNQFVVSYFDKLRKERVLKTFKEEWEAKELYSKLREKKPLTEEKRNLHNLSIEELVEIYFEEVPEATLRKTPHLIRDFLRQFSLFKVQDINEMKLRCFYTQQRIENNYTNYSLSTRKYQIQGFFKWLVSRGVIAESPQSKIRHGKSRVYRRRHILVSSEDFSRAIDLAQKFNPGFLYPILLLVFETAAKSSDIMDLKWKDIDFTSKKIHFPEREKIQQRDLTISERLASSIKQVDRVSDFVFTNLDGRPLKKEVLVRELRVFKKKVGIPESPDWVFRDLRFSFAVNFLKAGNDIRALQKIMGHWHPRLTEEIYGSYKIQDADIFVHRDAQGSGTSSSE